MPHSPPDLRKKLEAAAPPHVDWRFRPMFGGIGVYANDKMCVSLSDVGLAVKLAPADQDVLLKLKDARRLQYEPSSPPSKSYIVVPDAMLSDRKMLGHWLALSADHVSSAPAKKPRKTVLKPGSARPKTRRT
jgi:TfoX/Sxy family transcriptional regulator of competence genes